MTTTRERALEAALRRLLNESAKMANYLSDKMSVTTLPAGYTEDELNEHGCAEVEAKTALALPPTPQQAPVASGDWEIMGDGPEPFVGKPGIFGAEVRAALAPSRPVSHAELMQYARLIAAAPDLLAALLEYASLMERAAKLHPSRSLREVIGDPEGLAIRTRAAIARATGREG